METSQRIAMGLLALSAGGLVYIAQREDFRARAYPDPVHGAAKATYGYGSTRRDDGSPVRLGDTTTPPRALRRLRADAGDVEVALRRCIGDVPMHSREWDAIVALGHNAGPASVCKNTARTGPSTLVTRLQARDYAAACEAILLYKFAGGVDCSAPGNRVCAGVWTDRQRLRAMCLGEGAR